LFVVELNANDYSCRGLCAGIMDDNIMFYDVKKIPLQRLDNLSQLIW